MDLIADFFLVGGILVSIVIISLLLKSKKGVLPQCILVVFFSQVLFLLIHTYSDLHELVFLYVVSYPLADPIVWVVGPLLLLYVKSLFTSSKGLVKAHLIHFIPLIAYFLVITGPIVLSFFIENSYLNYIRSLFDIPSPIFILNDTYLILYLVLSLRLFSKYKKVIQTNEHTMNDHAIEWVRYLLIGALLVISLDFTIVLCEFIWGDYNFPLGHITAIALVIFIGYLGYHGINQSRVLVPKSTQPNPFPEKEKKHHLSSTREQDLRQLKEDFERIMAQHKPYLDEELTLHKLAQYIPTTDKKLSALLNQYMHTTFYDCINGYRVSAVKEKINACEFDNFTLLGIAYECGFNSKTSFNRIFKKETGLSPSEYRKSSLVLEEVPK